ncbi:hypothetical protein MRS44_003914 [Fusarium solani]|uniref:uncharacterized protein n=1 Tax=Fusarium solani TaxID=169388 RepID=UPI0032C3E5DF|nr:hypothetical protein MRS44_003914 [Fusarium solani]
MLLPSDLLRQQRRSPVSRHTPSQQLLPAQGSNLQVALPPPQKGEPQSSPVASRDTTALARVLYIYIMYQFRTNLKEQIDATIREIAHSPEQGQKIYEALAAGRNVDELTSLVK